MAHHSVPKDFAGIVIRLHPKRFPLFYYNDNCLLQCLNLVYRCCQSLFVFISLITFPQPAPPDLLSLTQRWTSLMSSLKNTRRNAQLPNAWHPPKTPSGTRCIVYILHTSHRTHYTHCPNDTWRFPSWLTIGKCFVESHFLRFFLRIVILSPNSIQGMSLASQREPTPPLSTSISGPDSTPSTGIRCRSCGRATSRGRGVTGGLGTAMQKGC